VIDLDGRACLVTGGSRGIGAAVCGLLARCGARVAVGYRRDATAAADVVSRIAAEGGSAVAVAADLEQPPAAEALVASAESAIGALDVLVVSHGIWTPAPILEMTPADWDRTLAVNLTSAAAVCRAAARRMAPRRAGAIVTIASTAGQRGEAGYAHYAASKGGIIALTKSLAVELAPHGIRVNGVAPGWVLTDMTRAALEGPAGEAAAAAIPVGRPGTPDEIAWPVAFLASGLASYMYGEIVAVNGGAVMVG
jgi:NAD(P)-dependent dehydrogenase (short-subunit alcohol dehydrogenase family)